MIDVAMIMPTRTAFDDALDFISEILHSTPGEARVPWIENLRLVHGICLSPDGEQYSHAWVEHFDNGDFKVWQAGLLQGQRVYYPMGRERFYDERQVIDSTVYDLSEAKRLNEEHDNFGPWEERYRALCAPRPGAREETGL